MSEHEIARRRAYRASLFHLLDDPRTTPPLEGWHDDGVLVVEDGRVVAAGSWDALASTLVDVPVTRFDNAIIVPGFIDAHVHYPQIDMLAAPGRQLLEWLTHYAFPAEMRFADPAVAAETADFFLDQLLRHGTTTALVFATVHRAAVEALFAAAEARNMCLITGKVLMDRGAPEALCDEAEHSYRESQALIDAWHGRGRLGYAVTPRFAPTCSDHQLSLAGKLLADNPDVHLHTHLSENGDELAWVGELFPDCTDYLAVYEKHGLVTDRAVFAHALHMSADEWARLGAAGAAVAFCPTSNLFLGSGLFDIAAADRARVPVGLGSDVGGGTSLSLLETMNEAYKVTHMRRGMLDAFRLFHLATLGGAKALKLEDRIGNFLPGKDADFLVLDKAATPLLARRMAFAHAPEEQLFALAMLGDDRAVAHTFVAGRCLWSRDAGL